MSNDATTVSFNGVNLSELYLITDVDRPYPKKAVTTKAVSGRDGVILAGANYEPLTISMKLTELDSDRETRRENMHFLMETLNVDEPQKLEFSDDGGKWYFAMPAGGGERTPYFTAESALMQFYIPDPVMYEGVAMSNPEVSGNDYIFGGNYHCKPVFVITGASAGASGYFGLRLDDIDVLKIALDSGTHDLMIDCDQRIILVDDAPALPTIDSDWFVCSPGTHEIENHLGSCSDITVYYWPRWL